MFADDVCVFCPSVRGLQSIQDVCQAQWLYGGDQLQ